METASQFCFGVVRPTCLHSLLLQEASEEILDTWGKGGISQDAAEKVGEWFTLIVSVVEDSLFNEVKELMSTEVFLNALEVYQVNSQRITSNGAKRPFFDPQILFIMVAHMVYLCTQSKQHGSLTRLRSEERVKDRDL